MNLDIGASQSMATKSFSYSNRLDLSNKTYLTTYPCKFVDKFVIIRYTVLGPATHWSVPLQIT